jgi:hypothetical protein
MAMGRSTDAAGERRTRETGGSVAADPLRKTGWQVRQSVADAVREAVANGAADSQNAFVERALIRELRELRRQRVYAAYAEAAADPVFEAEMGAVSAAWDDTVGDGLACDDGQE